MRFISEISVVASLLFAVACHNPQPGADLVPLPAEMTFTGGYFQTDSVSFARGVADGRVVCELDTSSSNLSREGYGLEVRSDTGLAARHNVGLSPPERYIRLFLSPPSFFFTHEKERRGAGGSQAQ